MEETTMQNWQKDRNYRKFDNGDGSFRHIIAIDGADVEVTAEVFAAYSQGDRRERYLAERDAGRLLSLDKFAEMGITLDRLVNEHIESAEALVLHTMLKEQVMAAFSLLKPEERDLVQAVVMDGVLSRSMPMPLASAKLLSTSAKNGFSKKYLK